MLVFEHPEFDDHTVCFLSDKESGLRAIIAIHRLFFNPFLNKWSSLGGLRMRPYKSVDEALKDVLRLSTGMSRKAALTNTDFGGAKAVIIGDPEKHKNKKLLQAFARKLNTFHGTFITGEDMGISEKDVNILHKSTRWVSGGSVDKDGCGDPSPTTALGVVLGIEKCVELTFSGKRLVSDLTFSIQGFCGNVGLFLTRHLLARGANIVVCDKKEGAEKIAQELCQKYSGASINFVEEPDQIFNITTDVFVPCAGGAILNERSIPVLAHSKCTLVAGPANNQLETDHDGDLLSDSGIFYAPDSAINAAGLIHVASDWDEGGFDKERVLKKVERIPVVLEEIFQKSLECNVASHRIANDMADEIIKKKCKIMK